MGTEASSSESAELVELFDFFISYVRQDAQWAEWIAWKLEAAGDRVFLQAWDFRPGENISLNMQKGATQARQTIAVLSPEYLKSDYCSAEWGAAHYPDPTGKQSKLLTVRVKLCEPEGLLKPIAYIDLVGTDEATASKRLLAGAKKQRAKPSKKPSFPGSAAAESSASRRTTSKPPFPAVVSAIWNITKRRNPHFMFREAELKQLDQTLKSGEIAALTQAIMGLGGVGKTQLAVEFAYRHASDFSIVWWIRSEEPSTLMADFAALAEPLGLPEANVADLRISVAAVKRALAQRGDWLLIFDNATDQQSVQDYLPVSPTGRKANKHAGRILLTSRNAKVASLGQTVDVTLFSRDDAADFLLKRCSNSPLSPGGRGELRSARWLWNSPRSWVTCRWRWLKRRRSWRSDKCRWSSTSSSLVPSWSNC